LNDRKEAFLEHQLEHEFAAAAATADVDDNSSFASFSRISEASFRDQQLDGIVERLERRQDEMFNQLRSDMKDMLAQQHRQFELMLMEFQFAQGQRQRA
jgi:hypothetical protein